MREAVAVVEIAREGWAPAARQTNPPVALVAASGSGRRPHRRHTRRTKMDLADLLISCLYFRDQRTGVALTSWITAIRSSSVNVFCSSHWAMTRRYT